MRTLATLSLFVAMAIPAFAVEHPLLFPVSSSARNVSVAGYQFQGNTVIGNCSYSTQNSSGGRGSHPVTVWHYNVCTWDFWGTLVSTTSVSSPMSAPAIIATNGTEVVYAQNGVETAGVDSGGYGFVDTPSSSHYSWVPSANGGYAVISDAAYTVTATIISDGQIPLSITGGQVIGFASGTYTPSGGTGVLVSTTCPSSLAPGASCSLTFRYDPTSIRCTRSPYGYAYTTVDFSPLSDSVAPTNFFMGFTITGVQICGD